ILSVTGARPDSVTDSHVAQLNPVKLQRICLENISFSKAYDKPLLQIGDTSLRRLADAGRFPTLALEKCQVTAPVVCLYTQRWLEKGIQTEGLRSHMCTLKQCPAVSNTVFEKECRRRSLDFENARGRRSSNASDTSEVTCYSIHSTENDREFTVALDDGVGLAPSGTIPALIALPV
ncbi:Protein T07E3.4 b, partial [Aphelenchoides avenae]